MGHFENKGLKDKAMLKYVELLNVLGYKPVNWIRGATEDPTAEPCKRQSYPITGLERPLVLQEFEATRISRQWAHEGGPLFFFPRADISGTHFC